MHIKVSNPLKHPSGRTCIMSDEVLSLLVSNSLQSFLSSGKISTPITSMDFLLVLISFTASTSASGLKIPRLSDLPHIEKVLEAFSSNWEHGSVLLSREDGELTITDVHLGNTRLLNPRKRKRAPIDEDADSAAGDNPDETSSSNGDHDTPVANTPLGSLSKDLREVYAILQKSTAKGRLLAERVRVLLMSMCCVILTTQN